MGSEVAESLGCRAKSRLNILMPLMMSVMSAPDVLAFLSNLRARPTASQVWIRRPHERSATAYLDRPYGPVRTFVRPMVTAFSCSEGAGFARVNSSCPQVEVAMW